jgi:hypothetical protein
LAPGGFLPAVYACPCSPGHKATRALPSGGARAVGACPCPCKVEETQSAEGWHPEQLVVSRRAIVREAVRTRYQYLPFWYTQFYLSSLHGTPVMRCELCVVNAGGGVRGSGSSGKKPRLGHTGLEWQPLLDGFLARGGLGRPLWVEFPEDKATFAEQGSHFVGSELLVAPVTQAGATTKGIYFPGSERWWGTCTVGAKGGHCSACC